MADSTIDGITVTSWDITSGFVDPDGVHVLHLNTLLTANDVIFTTLDDGDPITAAAVILVVTPDGGAPASEDQEQPAAEDTAYDLTWTPTTKGLYTAYAQVSAPPQLKDSTTINIRVTPWTEKTKTSAAWLERPGGSVESWVEAGGTAETWVEAGGSAETWAEKSPTAETWTEKTGDS